MKIYRKILVLFSNFNNKIICETNFGKTSKNVQVPNIRSNDGSNTQNQGINY